jgi:hypothetical protein
LEKNQFYLFNVVDSVSNASIDSILYLTGFAKGIQNILLIEGKYRIKTTAMLNRRLKKTTGVSYFFDLQIEVKKILSGQKPPVFIISDDKFSVLRTCKEAREVYHDFTTKYLQKDNIIDKALNRNPNNTDNDWLV